MIVFWCRHDCVFMSLWLCFHVIMIVFSCRHDCVFMSSWLCFHVIMIVFSCRHDRVFMSPWLYFDEELIKAKMLCPLISEEQIFSRKVLDPRQLNSEDIFSKSSWSQTIKFWSYFLEKVFETKKQSFEVILGVVIAIFSLYFLYKCKQFLRWKNGDRSFPRKVFSILVFSPPVRLGKVSIG